MKIDQREAKRDDVGDVDRLITTVLAVDPSPDFVSRIRTRIATEPLRNQWNHWWMIAVGGAVSVATVVVLGVVINRRQPPVSLHMKENPAAAASDRTEMDAPARAQQALAQRVTAQVRSQPFAQLRVLSGDDLGFRVEGQRTEQRINRQTSRFDQISIVTGRLMVKVNGQWVEAEIADDLRRQPTKAEEGR